MLTLSTSLKGGKGLCSLLQRLILRSTKSEGHVGVLICMFVNLFEMWTSGAVFCSKHQNQNKPTVFCFALQERACFVRSLKGGYDRDELSMFSPWP